MKYLVEILNAKKVPIVEKEVEATTPQKALESFYPELSGAVSHAYVSPANQTGGRQHEVFLVTTDDYGHYQTTHVGSAALRPG